MVGGEGLLLKDEVYRIVGASMEVYRHMRDGFAEAVYQEALEMEFVDRGIPFEPQVELPLYYKRRRLKKRYIADFSCYGQIVVEIKAISCLSPTEESQLLDYLAATRWEVGLLLNFGSHGGIQWKRMVRTETGIYSPEDVID